MKKKDYSKFRKGAKVTVTTDKVVYGEEVLRSLRNRGVECIKSSEVLFYIMDMNPVIDFDPIGTTYVLTSDVIDAGNGFLILIEGILYYPGFFQVFSPIKKRRKLTF